MTADAPAGEGPDGPIDRRRLVGRHDVRLRQPAPDEALTVGNGDFAFTADLTGMQTFLALHDPRVAEAEGRVALNTATLSTWCWHEMPNPRGYTLRDAETDYPTARGAVPYADRTEFDLPAGARPTDAHRAGTWLHVNPHRVDLGRIGLVLRGAPDAPAEGDAAQVTDAVQHLDLWTGLLTSRFRFRGEPVEVRTVADPVGATVAFRITSPLIAQQLLGAVLRFPYPSDTFFGTSDWSAPERHRSVLVHLGRTAARIDRTLDATTYSVRLAWNDGTLTATDDSHTFALCGAGAQLDLVATFGSGPLPPPERFDEVARRSAASWERFWTTGAAVTFAGSSDPRAGELERRIVLSQYLTAVHCSGAMPPQETGLATNSWSGKSHLEMHWWHAAHFALWGRPALLLRSLAWYEAIAPSARATARRQGYRGLRWPKQVGPDGRESPSGIGALLIWQQPHLISLLELLLAADPAGAADLRVRFAGLVEETAEFMADFVEHRDGVGHLPAPLMPAQEFYDARTTEDPTFELAYWWWALDAAQRWRERRGSGRRADWQRVLDTLARPRVDDGTYAAVGNAPLDRRDDHPSMLAAFGFTPPTPVIDPGIMERTLLDVRGTWQWDTAWGWDFPVMAMTATRLDRRDLAVDLLLLERAKNRFSATGHNPQQGNVLPIYLPGNGALLAAVALMVSSGGFPDDGSWTVRHEGFLPWPEP